MWDSFLAWLDATVEAHDQAQSQRVSLVASANAVSQRVRRLMNSDLVNRAAEGRTRSAVFPGLEAYYEFEQVAEQRVSATFAADFADIRPISGTQANHIIFQAFTGLGDTVAVTRIRDGGHVSVSGRVAREIRGLTFIPLPIEPGSIRLDLEAASALIRNSSPRLVFLGGSLVLEAQPLGELVAAARSTNAVVCFDASHVAGLIATGCFPNPLSEGADLLTMTTCKTIPGPSHAWILGVSQFRDRIAKLVFPGYVSGGHLQESVGAVAALAEMLAWPINYGTQVVSTARALGDGLEDSGIAILHTASGTATDTHQVLAWSPKGISGDEAVRRLAACNILVNANPIPEILAMSGDALRLGTQEITWRGATETTARELGYLVADVLLDRRDSALVARRVSEIATDALKPPSTPPSDYAKRVL